jgi:LysM repeat protein
MGRWGWRPLVVSTFMSVWVAGCNLLSDSAASTQPPSPYPPVTLTVGRASRAGPPVSTLVLASPVPATREPAPAASTPTPPPTASVYFVQPGDTALDIALNAGVDLPALRAANGGQMLSILTIGQELVIPPPSGRVAVAVASLPTTAPLALSVEGPNCTPFGVGESLCLGRVLNGQSVAAANVELTVTARSRTGQETQLALAVEQGVLPAGGWAPYRVQLPLPPDDLDSLIVSVSSADPADAPPVVDVADSQLAWRDGRAVVGATLTNTGDAPLGLTRALVTLQAADGRVLGYRVVPLDARLSPGRSTFLEATVVALSEPGLLPRVHIQVDAQPVP